MSEGTDALAGKAAELRAAFDRGFAAPPPEDAGERRAFLAIRVAGRDHAVALAEVAALFAGKQVTPLPSAAPALMGLAALRGEVVPVYRLSALLGGAADGDAPRWLILAAGARPVAFAFEALAGHLRPGRADIALAEDRATAAGVMTAAGMLPVVRIAPLLDRIAGHASAPPPMERQ